jgi:hypothetical protein
MDIGLVRPTCFFWPLCLLYPPHFNATRINDKDFCLFSCSCTYVEQTITDTDCARPQSENIGGKINKTT